MKFLHSLSFRERRHSRHGTWWIELNNGGSRL